MKKLVLINVVLLTLVLASLAVNFFQQNADGLGLNPTPTQQLSDFQRWTPMPPATEDPGVIRTHLVPPETNHPGQTPTWIPGYQPKEVNDNPF